MIKMLNEKQPLVSIGVPVFNGEKRLAVALDSLLNQDYPFFEIIISDNGSTDSTPDICRDYVNKDPRVKYFRSEKNCGFTWNFNRVFELSSGEYFMWAAHDDNRAPTFVSECVRSMEKRPDAVLCHVYTVTFIEGQKDALYYSSLDTFEKVSVLIGRYRETLKHFPMTAIYGLYRSSSMRKTHMFEKSMATDLAFIQELSIYGSFIQVHKELFTYLGRYKWNTVNQDFQFSFGKGCKPSWCFPFIALFFNHWGRISAAPVSFFTKLYLWVVLIQYQAAQVSIKVLIKIAGLFCPKRWKVKFASAIYRRWLHNPNIKVVSEQLFLERIIKPRIGWWK